MKRLLRDCRSMRGGLARTFRPPVRDRFEPDERDDRKRDAVHQLERVRPAGLHAVDENLGMKREQKTEHQNQRLAEDVYRAHETVERGAFAHADDVEH